MLRNLFRRDTGKPAQAHMEVDSVTEEPVVHCFCGGRLVPLQQFGQPVEKKFRGETHVARVCSECAYVSFASPGEEAIAEYYRTDYGAGSSDYYTLAKDYDPRRTNSIAANTIWLRDQFLPGLEKPRILELGCAFGGSVAKLRELGYDSFGIDANVRAIEEGRAHGNAYLFDCKLSEAPDFVGGPSNIVYSYHMLEHVPDLGQYLDDLRSVLADEGVAEFRVPNGAYLRPWLKGFEVWDWFAFPDHLHMLTPHSVAGLVDAHGYDLVFIESRRCGEPYEAIAEWAAPAFPLAKPELIEAFLDGAIALMELRFVITKRGSSVARANASPVGRAAQTCRRSRSVEAALKSISGS